MKVLNWKPLQKGTLLGFFDLLLDSGLQIDGMSLHEKDGKRWVSFPSRPYQGGNGETKCQAILRVPDAKRWQVFQKLAKAAVDKARKNGGGKEASDGPC